MAEKNQTYLRKIEELVDLMEKRDLVEVEIIDGDSKIHLKRPQPMMTQVAPAAGGAEQAAGKSAEDEKLEAIKSPMIGTFYASPSPDSEPYVKVGSRVSPDTVVCIVEAMKVMNELKAETSGMIVEVMRKGGEAVEFGQVLFKVKGD